MPSIASRFAWLRSSSRVTARSPANAGRPMRVAIINTTFLNGGDAAINIGTFRILRRTFGDDTEFVCFDSQPGIASTLYPEIQIRPLVFDRVAAGLPTLIPRKLALAGILASARIQRSAPDWLSTRLPGFMRRLFSDYAAFDVIVSAGGTYLVDRYRLAPRLFEFLLVLALGRPLVFFTQSIGPMRVKRDRSILGWIFKRSAIVMVRDDKSYQEMLSFGMSADRIARCPDAAFALAEAGRSQPVRQPGTPPRIAISVRNWPFFSAPDGGQDSNAENGMNRYLDAVAGFIDRVVQTDGAKVTLLSTCQGVGEYWTDDSGIAQQVFERLSKHSHGSVGIDRAFRTPDALIDRLKSFDSVVATRMHMAILALCAGRPVVPIAYEFKTEELFRTLGFQVPVSSIESVTAAQIYDAWRACTLDTVGHRASAGWERVEQCHERALDSGSFVALALAKGSAS